MSPNATAYPLAKQRHAKAMDWCLEGLSRHIDRCGRKTAERASVVGDEHLSAQLDEIADRIGNAGDASSYGRIDQILYPFYSRDIDSEVLSEEDTFDWTCHFMVNIWGVRNRGI